ncbi:SDR family oxidoreductase [Nonomuraea sp. K274]|uniref:SDR family oxidoreductase n=1 Tax=Nonomuraea cypriaca TaxID=1187855 RepID=A0A931AC14_9ACTN|nr:SDR family oxidoreductase [Nonomuraea cypriaca]MBF8187788.1 SDR family oxidoreductase [Nonomuraea cypriaca]
MEERTYVVTGAASGIGAATADHLSAAGARVIRCDVRDADVIADLTAQDGRSHLVSQVEAVSGGRIDGLVAVAGIAAPSPLTVRLSFFGTIATLDGLRPLLLASDRPSGPGWAGSGIPLNAVAPGVVDTETAHRMFLDDPATREFVAAAMPQPLGFPGPVAAIASLLAWTAGPDNAFMTGQILYADGGAEATLRP